MSHEGSRQEFRHFPLRELPEGEVRALRARVESVHGRAVLEEARFCIALPVQVFETFGALREVVELLRYLSTNTSWSGLLDAVVKSKEGFFREPWNDLLKVELGKLGGLEPAQKFVAQQIACEPLVWELPAAHSLFSSSPFPDVERLVADVGVARAARAKMLSKKGVDLLPPVAAAATEARLGGKTTSLEAVVADSSGAEGLLELDAALKAYHRARRGLPGQQLSVHAESVQLVWCVAGVPGGMSQPHDVLHDTPAPVDVSRSGDAVVAVYAGRTEKDQQG